MRIGQSRHKWRQVTSLAVVGLTLLASLSAAAAGKELRIPSPAEMERIYEDQILRAMLLSRLEKNTFYFVFQPDQDACNGPGAAMDLEIGKGGVDLIFLSRPSRVEFRVGREKKVETVTIEEISCLLEFSVAKEIRVHSDWTRADPRPSAGLVPLAGKQTELQTTKPPLQTAKFSFATGESEVCPHGGDFGHWWKASLLFFLGKDLLGEVVPRESALYESTFDFTRGDCRYVVSARMFGKTEDGLLPLRVRDLQLKGLN